MQKNKLSSLEKIVLSIIFILMIIGIIAAWVNKTWFLETYVVEDGFIEDVTLIPLAILTLSCLIFLFRYARKKNAWFFVIYLFIALGSFFILGEEISWGQRIFGFETSEYFREHNSQDEENIHNLIIGGEKLNKIIFTDVLVAGVAIYLIVFPWLYNKKPGFKSFVDKAALPIAQLYQIIGCLLVFGLSFLTFDSKGAELLEFGGSAMFMLIVLFPLNKSTRSIKS
jgi:hypothetical protein